MKPKTKMQLKKGKNKTKQDVGVLKNPLKNTQNKNLSVATTIPALSEKGVVQSSQLKYICVYGIINSDIEVGMEGLKGESIKRIKFKDVWVLTSPYPSLHPIIEDKEVMQYAEILKKVAEKTTTIPMAFGTVFKDQKILEGVLSKSYDLLKSTFIIIDNKIELGIKVLKKPDEDANEKLIPEILEPLKKLSIKSLEGDKFSDRLLLNHSFLVEKSRFSEFSEKIAELEMSNKDLKFVYTGPWPPYSFVNIKIAGGS